MFLKQFNSNAVKNCKILRQFYLYSISFVRMLNVLINNKRDIRVVKKTFKFIASNVKTLRKKFKKNIKIFEKVEKIS